MKKFLFALTLLSGTGIAVVLLIAIGLAAQTPTPPAVSTVTYNSLDLTKLNGDSAQTGLDLIAFVQTANGNFNALATGINQAATAINDPVTGNAALHSAIAAIPPGSPGPQGPAGPLAAPIELMLVIPYGSTGYSITSLGALAEYPPAQRTRRVVDFTNVHQTRSCVNVIAAAAAGSSYVIQQSPNQTFSAPVVVGDRLDLTFETPTNSLICSLWQPYAGPGGDQFIRVAIAGSGSVTLDFISLQLR